MLWEHVTHSAFTIEHTIGKYEMQNDRPLVSIEGC